MKKSLFLISLISLIIVSSCSPQLESNITSTPPTTFTPSSTPTRTPTITKTPLPTKTPTPTFLPVSTLLSSNVRIGTPFPETTEQIQSNNIDRLSLFASWGQGVLSDISYSPDGNLLAISTTAGVAVYDGIEPSNRLFFLDTLTAISSLKFSPDSNLLAVVSNTSSKIQIWDISNQTIIKEMDFPDRIGFYIEQIGFSVDGKGFGVTVSKSFTPDDKEFTFWNVSGWNIVHRSLEISNFAFSPDGQSILLVKQKTGTIYNINDWKSQKTFSVEYATSAVFSQDGKKVIVGNITGTVQVVDIETGKLVYMIEPLGYIRSEQGQYACDDDFSGFHAPQYSPPFVRDIKLTNNANTFSVYYDYDGSIVSSIRVYNLDDGSFVDEYIGDDIRGFDFSPDSKSLALNMRRVGSVHIWNIRSKELVNTILSFNTPAFDVKFSPDGEFLSIIHGDSTRIREVTNGVMVRNTNSLIAFSPANQKIALGGNNGTISIENIYGSEKNILSKENGWILDLIYSSDGDWIISSTVECSIKILSASDGSLIKYLDSPTSPGMNVENTRVAVAKLLLSPDKKFLVGGDVFGSLTIWNLVDGTIQRLNTGDNDPKGLAMSLSPDGKTLAIATIGVVYFYDITTGDNISHILIPSDKDYSYTVTAVAFSSDGNLLAAGLDDGTVYIFPMNNLIPIYHFHAHHNISFEGVASLSFSPDNTILISSGYDGIVKIWGIKK